MEAPWKVLLRFTPPLALHPSNAQGQHSLMDIVNIFSILSMLFVGSDEFCPLFIDSFSFLIYMLSIMFYHRIIVSLSYHFLMPRIQDFVGEPGRPSAIQLCGLALTCVC